MSERTDDPERTGTRSRDEVRELLRRRRLSPKTIGTYLATLARAEAWCHADGLGLDELGAEDLERFASTLPQTRPSLASARSALACYFAAIGRRDAPSLELAERLGRAGRDADEGLAALDLARQLAGADNLTGTTWRDVGYDPAWLRTRFVGRQLNRRTAYDYVRVLRRVQRFCELAGSSVETASAAELEAFATTVASGRSSRQQLRSALVHYYAVIRRPDPPVWGIRVPRKPRMLSRALDGEDARRLAAAAIGRDDRRGLAVVIGLYLGLRRFEIAKLRWADFDGEWLHLIGKGDVEARLPVHPTVRRYLDRQRNVSPFVFPAPGGGSVHPTTVWTWVRRVSVDAGFDAVPTHVLRHTALTVGNDATGDLRAVQDYARHAQVETTAGYTRTTVEHLTRVGTAIGDWLEGTDPDSRDPGTSGVGAELPTLSFRELVAMVEGAHAVEAWAQLAGPLSRRGWRLAGTLSGTGTLWLAFSPFLDAHAMTNTTGGPPSFYITRYADPEADPGTIQRRDERYDAWQFADVADLLALAPLFEQGLPVPEPDSGVDDGGHWVLESVPAG